MMMNVWLWPVLILPKIFSHNDMKYWLCKIKPKRFAFRLTFVESLHNKFLADCLPDKTGYFYSPNSFMETFYTHFRD